MRLRADTTRDGDYFGEPPRPSLEERVVKLEVMMQLIIRHLRGTDRMSDEELEKMEEDINQTLHSHRQED